LQLPAAPKFSDNELQLLMRSAECAARPHLLRRAAARAAHGRALGYFEYCTYVW
jgi:hypothetical protein